MDTRLATAEQAYRQGAFEAAERSCLELVAEPDGGPPRAWYLLGIIAHKTGRYAEAARRMQEAVRLAPNDPEILTHGSEVLRRAGELALSVSAARQAVRVWPGHPAPLNNLGLALRDSEQFPEAEDCFRRAVALDPSYVRGHLNLGNLLHAVDRPVEAMACFQQALRLRPDYPEALNSAGQLSKELGKPKLGVELLQRALRARPGYPKARLNLANALAELEHPQEAEQILIELTQSQPDYVEAWHDLGAFYERRKRVPEAVDAYRRVTELQPDSMSAAAALENAKRNVCDWAGWPESIQRLVAETRRLVESGKPSPLQPLVSCRLPTTSADRRLIAEQYARRVASRVGGVCLTGSSTKRGSQRPIRLGFLSHEFRYHVVSHLMLGLFRRFDRRRFEVFAFDYSRDDGSPMRERIAADVDHFVSVGSGTDRARAEKIAAAQIDILFDINSYMPGGRPEIAACRPAPVQISHMYPATTGAAHLDYFITDPVVTPDGDEQFFTEQLIYLPCCYLPTDSDQPIAAHRPTREECGLPSEGVVFGSFNKSDKIEPHLFDVWMRILNRVPASVLWLRGDGPVTAENLRREAAARGVDPQRLVFATEVPGLPEHLARQQNADLFLDTWTHGAHGTAVDALWAGLPLLTCPGETFTARVATSLLHAVGLTELIAGDLDDYERLAVELTTAPDRLVPLRQKLESARESGDLLCTDRYIDHLQQALEAVWRRHCEGMPPGPIRVG